MGFSKDRHEPEVTVEVTHPWYPGETFTFHFPKVLPQSALDAEKTLTGLKDDERADARRLALINVVAEMSSAPPGGFDDFPTGNVAGSVADHVRAYFDDPTKPELEQIVAAAWLAYKGGALPSAYFRRVQRDGAGGGDLSRVPAKATP